jgi:hydroxymethylbilane synthase
VLPRLAARECLVGASSLAALAEGGALAVVDVRASLVVQAIRDDLRIEVADGAKAALAALDAGRAEAALVGRCDLDRVDRGDEVGRSFEELAFPPPPARGAVSLLVRDHDEAAAAQLARLDDVASRAMLNAELAFEEAAPDGFAVGAFAMLDGELLALRALLGRSADGRLWFGDAAGPSSTAAALGRGLAAQLAEAVD